MNSKQGWGIAAPAVGLLMLGGVVLQPVTVSAVEPGPKCEAAKLKESAKKAKCDANVSAKAIKKLEAVDASKLAKCSTKFNDKFAKAETKAEGACPTDGDASAIEAFVDGCVDGVVSDLGGVPGPGGDEAKCQSKKVKESGKYAQCRLKASSKAVKKGLAPDYGKCETKLADKWAKIEAKTTCLTTGDLASVKAQLDACHVDVTDSLSGVPLCGNGTLNAGEQCDDGNTSNGDGCSDACTFEPVIMYQQDFESLVQADGSALGNDGWLVGANVFAGPPPGGAYLYGYFSFPAPNGGAAFSALDVGQGGAEQGTQQLVVYSDYDNGDHGNGNTIDALVFQEQTIAAADIGRTVTFQFDAKLGNLELLSTAEAFIKTIDPGNGFAQTNYVTIDMTAAPVTWGTYSISLDLTDPLLENQLLQFGFGNKATLYQGSGVFYDNVVVSTLPTP